MSGILLFLLYGSFLSIECHFFTRYSPETGGITDLNPFKNPLVCGVVDALKPVWQPAMCFAPFWLAEKLEFPLRFQKKTIPKGTVARDLKHFISGFHRFFAPAVALYSVGRSCFASRLYKRAWGAHLFQNLNDGDRVHVSSGFDDHAWWYARGHNIGTVGTCLALYLFEKTRKSLIKQKAGPCQTVGR